MADYYQEICSECDQILAQLDNNKDFQDNPMFWKQSKFIPYFTKPVISQLCVYCTYLNKSECICKPMKTVLKKDNAAYKKRVEFLKWLKVFEVVKNNKQPSGSSE